jgi:hypothetical protein
MKVLDHDVLLFAGQSSDDGSSNFRGATVALSACILLIIKAGRD